MATCVGSARPGRRCRRPGSAGSHDAVGVPVSSIAGGTDVCTAFVGSSPLVPVRAGEISCRLLGCAVEAFTPDGRPAPPGQTGELVVTAPMPSMPVGFWGDDDGSRYRAAYFDDFPGVWRHGDWITFTDDGACVISGRSDATLNRGGVRLGTSDFYAVVEGVRRGGRQPRRAPRGRRRRRARPARAVRRARRRCRARRRPDGPDPRRAARRAVAAPRARRHRGRPGRAAHAVGQEAGGAREADPDRDRHRRSPPPATRSADPAALEWFVARAAT